MMRRADERFWNGACEALVRCDADEGRWRVFALQTTVRSTQFLH